jgi:hypothetical protein
MLMLYNRIISYKSFTKSFIVINLKIWVNRIPDEAHIVKMEKINCPFIAGGYNPEVIPK